MRLRTLLSNAYNRGLQLIIEKDKLNKEIHNFCDKFLIDSFEIVNLDWLHLQFLYDQLPITKYFHSLRIFLMDFFDSSYYYNNSNCMIILTIFWKSIFASNVLFSSIIVFLFRFYGVKLHYK